ncbi:zinc finger protein Pegasus-like [Ptychodera flava]|uniref:zinc finger protein Pegasus-like n=1 Tax=Ptychodera flava TaxID=63121 RepID=UPI00396A96C1
MSDGGKQVIWIASKDTDGKAVKDGVKEEEELNDEDSIEEILDDEMEDESRGAHESSVLGNNEDSSPYILTQARFQCSMCHFVASCHQAYTDHMNIHTGIKPYCCQYCPFSSAFRSSLLRHVKIHTNANEKPFRCARCSYESRYKWNVTVHMRKCHKDFSDCPVSTPSKSSPSPQQPLPKIGSVFSVNPPISQSSEASSEMSSSPEPTYAPINANSSTEERDESRQKQTPAVLQSPPSTEPQVFHFSNSVTSLKQTELVAEKYYQIPNDSSYLPRTAAALKLLPSMSKSFGFPQIRNVPYTITAPLSHNMAVTPMSSSVPPAAEISPVTVATSTRDAKSITDNRQSQENQAPLQNERHNEETKSQSSSLSGSPQQQEIPKATFKSEGTQTVEQDSSGCSRCELIAKNLKSCPHCGTLFSDNVIYTLHMSCHGSRHPFQCAICGYECRDKIEFTCHITRSQHKN